MVAAESEQGSITITRASNLVMSTISPAELERLYNPTADSLAERCGLIGSMHGPDAEDNAKTFALRQQVTFRQQE